MPENLPGHWAKVTKKNSNQGALSTYMCLEWWIFVLRPWLISYYFQISHAIQLEFKSQPCKFGPRFAPHFIKLKSNLKLVDSIIKFGADKFIFGL